MFFFAYSSLTQLFEIFLFKLFESFVISFDIVLYQAIDRKFSFFQ